MIPNKDFYFQPTKIIRDLVHGYINLTEFELSIIDTAQFQRLKDIRQLTCQHVYPSAHHTRFDHSLGVLELTKQAIKHINRNGVIGRKEKNIIDDELYFNATLAALLHDVGHCPFSHLGEVEVDAEEVRKYLSKLINSIKIFKNSNKLINKLNKKHSKEIGSKHEQLSCIVILEKYYEHLVNISSYVENNEIKEFHVDFELLIRCILGIPYDINNTDDKKNMDKNLIIGLINSAVFDMDKLDYIMRDSYFTGIGTPKIDTQRLFRNMYLTDNHTVVFTSRAIPALQNMIDSRDELYMYVYNHHAVVFSDFMNAYILRKFAHNSQDFIDIFMPKLTVKEKRKMKYCETRKFKKTKQLELDSMQISSLGIVSKSYLFSVGSIVGEARSDSDWVSLINIVQYNNSSLSDIKLLLAGELDTAIKNSVYGHRVFQTNNNYKNKIDSLGQKIFNTYDLVNRYTNRRFLKPWWKTVFEFSNFMNQNFRDDKLRDRVGKLICKGNDVDFDSSEFRSQIAKNVIYITEKLKQKGIGNIIESLGENDFFIVQRSNRFLDLKDIEKLDIALKSSEIIGSPNDIRYRTNDYYIKFLTSIIPQKDYSSIYAKEGFYIYSVQIEEDDINKKRRHYEEIERIFVFVAMEFAKKGDDWFKNNFNKNEKEENVFKKTMCAKYIERYYE